MVKIQAPGLGGGTVQGWPPNRPKIASGKVALSKSGVPQFMPSLPIPDGFSVLFKASKGNTGTITVAGDKGSAINTGSNFSLAANEAVRLFVTDLSVIAFDGTVSGDNVEYIVEQ